MQEKNNILLIILVSIILFSIKWVNSLIFFPDEEITLRIISEAASDSYFHYVKVLSELSFNNTYSLNKSEYQILVPIGSVIFHSIAYKIIGIYSFIILELVFIFLFVFVFYSIFIKLDLNKRASLFFTVFIFSLPTLIDLVNLDITLLNNFGLIFYNLKFPRPLVTNIYLFYFLYLMVTIYNKELFTKKNIYTIGIFFALVLSSSFFIFLPLSIFLLIFVLKRNKFKVLLEKIKEFKKHLISSFLIFLIISFIFVYLMINSNPDYSTRMGIININTEDKLFLLEYYFNRLIKHNSIILIIVPVLLYFITRKYLFNKNFYIVDIFFLNYICSFINPFIFILISNKVAFLNHTNNLIIINLFLYFFITIVFICKIFLEKINLLKTRVFIGNTLIIILILINFFNANYFNKNLKVESGVRVDKNKIIKKIKHLNRNCSILTFDNSIMTYLILEKFKYLPYINGTFANRDDRILENDLINSLKILNLSSNNFEDYLQSYWDGSRLKNSYMQQLFWQKYQANSFYTYENSKNFKKNEFKIISNTSPSIIHQFVIPIYEKKRLLNKFEKYKINNVNMPDYIIIDKTDKFWSNENITKNKFKIFLENESFKIYSKNLPSTECK